MKTTVEAGPTVKGPTPRYLLATTQGGLRVYPLPEEGEIVVGRGTDCGAILDHPKVSRHHVRLRLGQMCTIADLGSRNGTMFHGNRLAPEEEHELRAGESFSVGPFSLMLLPPGAALPLAPAGRASFRIEDPTVSASSPLLVAVARAPVNVIIRGETGVGKEVLAGTLHQLSGRKGPFVGVNCAAMTESLLESELFGHERGAFTGATQSKPGLLESAGGGTVLLDEIGEMAPALQAKLLRAIEAREVFRVGGVKAVPLDVRFLAATHRELADQTDGAGLRRDLYYRLAGITLEIPPLRTRRERVGALAVELLAQAARRGGIDPPAISAEAATTLVAHNWPGNVRELRNVVERALLLSGGGEIRPEHVAFDTSGDDALAASPDDSATGDSERMRILVALEECSGNQTRAARMLGISRATLVNKLSIHRIPRPRKPHPSR